MGGGREDKENAEKVEEDGENEWEVKTSIRSGGFYVKDFSWSKLLEDGSKREREKDEMWWSAKLRQSVQRGINNNGNKIKNIMKNRKSTKTTNNNKNNVGKKH